MIREGRPLLSAAILCTLCLSCDDAPISTPHNFEQINHVVLQASCSTGGDSCHKAEGNAGGLDLETDPYASIVGTLARNPLAKSQGLSRVAPCDAPSSFLFRKVCLPSGANPDNCLEKDSDSSVGSGAHMPGVTGVFLTPELLQALRDWISRGALKTEPPDVTGTTCLSAPDSGTD